MARAKDEVKVVKVKCPNCGQEYEAKEELVGRFGCINCPKVLCEVVQEAKEEKGKVEEKNK